MMKNGKFVLILLSLVLILPLESCVVSRPVRPGPNYIWMAPRTTHSGVVIPGHWIYKGKPYKNKVWVPGHHNRYGKWVPGHWKKIRAPRKNAVWVPGHWTPNGNWKTGHWRYR